VHGIIRQQNRRQPIPNLMTCASESVEYGVACSACKRALAIRGERVGHGAFLDRGSEVTPPAHVSVASSVVVLQRRQYAILPRAKTVAEEAGRGWSN
jgi:hypothetical protein